MNKVIKIEVDRYAGTSTYYDESTSDMRKITCINISTSGRSHRVVEVCPIVDGQLHGDLLNSDLAHIETYDHGKLVKTRRIGEGEGYFLADGRFVEL